MQENLKNTCGHASQRLAFASLIAARLLRQRSSSLSPMGDSRKGGTGPSRQALVRFGDCAHITTTCLWHRQRKGSHPGRFPSLQTTHPFALSQGLSARREMWTLQQSLIYQLCAHPECLLGMPRSKPKLRISCRASIKQKHTLRHPSHTDSAAQALLQHVYCHAVALAK